MYKVVHEPPKLPGQIEGLHRPRFYDAILARALAKNPDQRFADAGAFRNAIQRGVGQPIDTTVWEQTLLRSTAGAAQPGPAAAPAPTGSGSSWTSLPTHWDKAVLQQAEASLARHVGPLAAVLVRRAARECTDLQSLYARLAEQVPDAHARTAFLDRATSISGVRAPTSHPGTSGTRAAPPAASSTPLADATIDAAARLLATHVGPIAKVMARKAAARTQDRREFFVLLSDAVPEGAARKKLLDELLRLA